jgi:hypothetical protein
MEFKMLRSLILMTSVVAAGSSTAGSVPPCVTSTLPVQITNEALVYPVTTLSGLKLASFEPPQFRTFVTAVTEHIATRLASEKSCIDSADSTKQSLVQFVKWQLVTSGNEPLVPTLLPLVQPSGACRITSPWIDLSLERGPTPQIRAVIRWNDRQFLVDQAVLSDARDLPLGVAMPLKQRDYSDFAYGYANSEILRKPVTKSIEARIPPDMLWLFRRSWQTTLIPFTNVAMGSMNMTIEKGAASHTQLVIALINRCLDSRGGADIHYSSIFDVSDLISLEKYKINRLID